MTSVIFKVISHGSPEYKACVALREEILRKPLGLTILPEEMEIEKAYIAITGFFNDEIVAATVLVPEGQTCRMKGVVVKNDMQDHGIGSQMLRFCEVEAITRGFQSIYCYARETAVNFYLKNNYLPEGDYFGEDTIPHLKMRKAL